MTTYREPEFLPWDGRRVPLTFVGGYLGAGKTSAINEVLAAADRPIAVIVNDVGAINIDARLVKKRNSDTLELTDGCVCCSSIDGFGAAFDQIRSRESAPEHVIVELSGVAEVSNVIPWGSSAGFMLDGVVIVAAVDQLVDTDLPDWVRQHIDRQVSEADLLVLTKTDLVNSATASAARERLGVLAPGVPVVDRGQSGRDSDALGRFLALGGHRAGDITSIAGPTLFDLHQTDLVTIDGPLTRDQLEAVLDQLPQHIDGQIVRAKGVIATPDDELLLVQLVGRRREISPLLASERQAPTDLVVISLRAISLRD